MYFEKCKYSDIDYLYYVSCTLICTIILIIMLTLTMSHNSHTPPTFSHTIPVILSCHLYLKHKNYCRKYCINYNSIVTTPVYWNSHSPVHTIKLVYYNNHPDKLKLI